MPSQVSDVIHLMDSLAPRWMAAENDPVGLHAGHPDTRVRKVLVVLDATLAAVDEARRRKCDMIVAHHPRFYRSLTTLDETTPAGRLATAIARAGLAVFCAHTNLDSAPGGINDILADLAGLKETRVLRETGRDPHLKLAVFVPESHLAAVREAICDAGAGLIGEYEECSFRSAGIGSFRGSESSNPAVGQAGQFEEVEEWRLEVLLPQSRQAEVVRALRETHPYEEPAYDLYRLVGADSAGCGRVGELPRPVPLKALAKKMKKATRSPGTLVLGDPDREVKRLAVWSGGGCPAELIARSKVDAVVLGEVGYHDTERYFEAGIGCIALGHAPCEEIVLEPLARNLQEGLEDVAVEVFFEATPKMWSV